MQLRYALYERTQAGYGWTWRAVGLSDALLDDFRYRITVPDDSNSIRPEQLRGGLCKFDRSMGDDMQEHVVLYRFFDGGTDEGRPNRVVMLTAWTTPDQIAESPNRYGLAGLLRNRVFEYVSNNARAVGIAPPPFGESLAADAEFSDSSARRVPSVTLMGFIDNEIKDTDNVYYVTIRDDEYSVQRKPSLAFERKEQERQAHEKRLLAAERLRVERELASREAAAANQERHVAAGAGNLRGGITSDFTEGDFLMKVGIAATVLMLCVVVGVVVLQSSRWLGWGQKRLSVEAEAVLTQFKGLEPDEQRTVLTQLTDWCQQHQRPKGRQLAPGNPGVNANPGPPSLVAPKQAAPRQVTPNAGQAPPGSPSEDQGGVRQPLR